MCSRAPEGHGDLAGRSASHSEYIYESVMERLDQAGFGDWRVWATAAARGRVLEIGVGRGMNLVHYSRAAQVVAFDPDAERLAEIQGVDLDAAHPLLLSARAEGLPFPSDCFDAAVGTLVFCTIPKPGRALAEVHRVLKPRSYLRLVEHVRAGNPLAGLLMDAATPVWKQIQGGCHLNRDTLSEVRKAGFEVTRLYDKWFGLLIGIEARK